MKILLIEDDISLCESLKFQLEKEGFSTDCCHDGEESLAWIDQQAHDLILLDRMLPHLDGISILKYIRDKNYTTAVILITALGELNDKIIGLDSGADDYIVKPFAFEELMARIRSINRRPRIWEDTEHLAFGDITFDSKKNLLYGKDKTNCSLSKREGDLLNAFIQNKNQTLTRELLLNRVWGLDADVEGGNLDNYIHFIRRRLKTVGSHLNLKTVRGVGYRLEDENV
jgi:DNA-binding response OmpR family regulator